MFLKYSTRKGHFNMLDPSEESFSCHVAVYDSKANKIKHCNFTPEYELNGTDVDEISAEIEESLARYWTTGDDRKEFVAYLAENQEEIERGNTERRLAEIKTEIDALQEEQKRLEKRLTPPQS